jgi:hypothetical protein
MNLRPDNPQRYERVLAAGLGICRNSLYNSVCAFPKFGNANALIFLEVATVGEKEIEL